jgi:hypothetical protein
VSGETDTAAPAPAGATSMSEGVPAADTPSAEPTDTVAGGERTASHPAGTAMPEGGIPIQERPEAQVGAAFAGGLLAAVLLRKVVG